MDESTFFTVMARFQNLMTVAFEQQESYEGQVYYEAMRFLVAAQTAAKIEREAEQAVRDWSPNHLLHWHVQFEERAALLAHAEACSKARRDAWDKYVMASEIADSFADDGVA